LTLEFYHTRVDAHISVAFVVVGDEDVLMLGIHNNFDANLRLTGIKTTSIS